jgi:hypothetical protein
MKLYLKNKNTNNIVGVDAFGEPLPHLGLRAAVGVSPYKKNQNFVL